MLNKKTYSFICLFTFSFILFSCASNSVRNQKKVTENNYYHTNQGSKIRPVVGTKGMVVADDEIAAKWGVEILKRGGNAIDAAVATAFAMAVTRPHYAALGGGGFLVYCPKPKNNQPSDCSIIDYREQAPSAAHRDMYLIGGKARTDLSQDSPLGAGVPGTTAGLLLALKKFGTKSRKEILSRPIQLAQRGFSFTGQLEVAANNRWSVMNDAAKLIFGCAKGKKVPSQPCEPGDVLRQKDLARVLRQVSAGGSNGFYRGWVAKRLSRGISNSGGIINQKDLASYRAIQREPVSAFFRGNEIVTMPPPSAGGVTMLQMFQYAEKAHQQGGFEEGFGSSKSIHSLVHSMSLAFADRAKHFGDPDYYSVPIKELLSKRYLDRQWKSTFKLSKASLPKNAGVVVPKEGNHTTHFSVIDKEGNAVSITTTVNNYFGSGFVPPGTGVVMNDEMDDFSMQPGVPNMFGLVGAEANAIEPYKRPLSSMSPTIVRDKNGNNLLVIGASGGPRITTSVFLSLFNRLYFGMSLPDAVNAQRFHHQWKPKVVFLERFGFSADTRNVLLDMGYEVKETTGCGRIHALERLPNGRTWGVPDHRAEGVAVAE